MSNMILESGGIVPYKQKVRQEGQAEVFATTVDELENVSARERLAFSWSIVPAANATASDTLLLVQCDSDDLVLHIQEIHVETDTDSGITVHLTDRAALTVAGGVLVVGVCLNQTAPRVAPAIARFDETSNVEGNIIWDHEILADIYTVIDLHGAALLGKGQSIAVDQAATSTISSCSIFGFFAIPDEKRQ